MIVKCRIILQIKSFNILKTFLQSKYPNSKLNNLKIHKYSIQNPDKDKLLYNCNLLKELNPISQWIPILDISILLILSQN